MVWSVISSQHAFEDLFCFVIVFEALLVFQYSIHLGCCCIFNFLLSFLRCSLISVNFESLFPSLPLFFYQIIPTYYKHVQHTK